MNAKLIALIIFIAAYSLFIILPRRRTWVAIAGALLVGPGIGGNITPIGASANIVTMGLLKKNGYKVSFWEFSRIGIPFTLISVTAACLLVWTVWGR